MGNVKQYKGRLVKITRQAKIPGTERLMYALEDEKEVPYMEDIVCEELYWATETRFDENGNQILETIVYLRRIDDGSVEWAIPGSLVYLDIIENYEEHRGENSD